MEIQNLREHVDTRLDRLEEKLDRHMDRVSKVEAAMEHVRGSIKIITTVVIGAVTAAVTALFSLIGR